MATTKATELRPPAAAADRQQTRRLARRILQRAEDGLSITLEWTDIVRLAREVDDADNDRFLMRRRLEFAANILTCNPDDGG